MSMSILEIMRKDKTAFDGFDYGKWTRYYKAINAEVPVDKVKDKPYYLKLTDSEKQCYQISLDELKEERKTAPWASYEVRSKDYV